MKSVASASVGKIDLTVWVHPHGSLEVEEISAEQAEPVQNFFVELADAMGHFTKRVSEATTEYVAS